MDLVKAMELAKIALMVVGAVVVGMPVMLRVVLAILKVIPGDQGEAMVEKVIALSEKLAEVAVKVLPKSPESK